MPFSRRDSRKLLRTLRRMMDQVFPGRALELSVSLVGESTMKKLNQTYRGRDEATDVLAFPQMTPVELMQNRTGRVEPLGDIAICVPVAEMQASERMGSVFEELELLAAHGVLHLAGYDDQSALGASVMAEAERRLLGRTFIE